MKHKKILKSILFFVILIGLMVGSSNVSRYIAVKTKDNSSLKRYAIETELLSEKENSIDVLVLGDSECYTSISPYQILGKIGVPAFLASQSGQSTGECYHLLKMALERQKPKVVFIEANLFYMYDGYRGAGMAAFNTLKNEYFGIFRYHSIWKSAFSHKHPPIKTFKGFGVYSSVQPAPNFATYMQDRGETKDVSTPNKIWADVIFNKVKSAGAKLVLYSAPSPMNHSLAKHKALSNLAKEYGADYLDMNTDERLQLDWAHDMLDGGDHINVSGAERTTNLVISYLMQYNLRDKRNDKEYSAWNEESKNYENTVQPIIKQIREAQ